MPYGSTDLIRLRSWIAGLAPAVVGAAGFSVPHVPAAAAEDRTRPVLEEVIVTATRRPELLERVPLSVHVLTGEELSLRGARNFRDYANAVAGVSFSDVGYTDAKVTIRGVSTDVYSEIRPLTATYLDEVAVTHPGAHLIVQSDGNPELVDIERVEILRGPQGSSFGASAMGGVVRVVTQKPDPARFAGYAETMVSATDHGGLNYGIDGVLNQPLGRNAALRLVGYHRDNDGFIDNVGTGRDDINSSRITGGRLAYRATLGDRAEVFASLLAQSQRTDGLGQENIELDRYTQRTLIDERYDDDWILPNLVITYDLGWADLLSSTAWQERDWLQLADTSGFADFLDAPGIVISGYNMQDLSEFIQELRLSSKAGGRFDWLAGLYFNDREHVWRQTFPAPGLDAATGGEMADFGAPDNLGIGHVRFRNEHLAVFGEIEWPFATHWQVTVGGRWFRFDESSHVDSVGFLYNGPVVVTRKGGDSGFVPRLTLSWRPDEDGLVYATVAKGFRPSGPNFQPVNEVSCAESLAAIGLTEAPVDYKSDSLWNYEIGGRFNLLDGRLRASASLYHVDWTDVQILAFLQCGTGFMSNAGKALSEGVEFEVDSRLTDSTELSIGLSYIDAKLTKDAPTLSAPSGSRLPGVPRWSGYGSVTQWFALAADRSAYLRAALRYVDETFGTFVPGGATRLVAPSYAVMDLRLGIDVGRWNLALFAENLLDEYGIVNSVDDFGLHPGGQYQNLVRPRTIGLSVRASFH